MGRRDEVGGVPDVGPDKVLGLAPRLHHHGGQVPAQRLAGRVLKELHQTQVQEIEEIVEVPTRMQDAGV